MTTGFFNTGISNISVDLLQHLELWLVTLTFILFAMRTKLLSVDQFSNLERLFSILMQVLKSFFDSAILVNSRMISIL